MGYDIRSLLPFRTLRGGGGVPLFVDERADLSPGGELVGTWHPRPGNAFHGRLMKDGGRYAFWASDAGWFVIDPTVPSITVATGTDPLLRELRLFGVPTALCAFEGGDVSVHASAVEIFGHGVLFAGPSMYGKTTLAAALARAGHRLLSEDTTRCTTSPRPSIYPGPAVVRLRADVARFLQVPGATGTATEEGRVPLIFDARLRGDGAAVPLRAIVILRTHADAPALRKLSTAEAARDVFALTFRLPTAEARAACFARVVDLTANTETLNLQRPMTMESLDSVVSLIELHISGPG